MHRTAPLLAGVGAARAASQFRIPNGRYDIECAHGSREEKVGAQWIRPRAPGDNIKEFAGVWAWKPQGKLTEDELVLKNDGMCSLRSGAVGTWAPKDTKGKGRTTFKIQLPGAPAAGGG